MEGTRLPGDRRVKNRDQSRKKGIDIPQSLYDKIKEMM